MKAILHCDKNWGIGKNNNLMFRLAREFFFCKMRGYQIFHLLLSFCKATI